MRTEIEKKKFAGEDIDRNYNIEGSHYKIDKSQESGSWKRNNLTISSGPQTLEQAKKARSSNLSFLKH